MLFLCTGGNRAAGMRRIVMLIGNVFYYSLNTGRRLVDMDIGVSVEYARSISKEWPQEKIVWVCTNGHPSHNKAFIAGKEVAQ